jgi:hypothetical protein
VSDTLALIDRLAARAAPVRRLRPPLQRAFAWLGLALAVILLIGLLRGFRDDIAVELSQPVFLAGIGAALLTAVLGAIAAFQLSLPDRSRLWLLLPIPAAAAWLATVTIGCLANWVIVQHGSFMWPAAMSCLVTLTLVSLPLSAVMFWMLRHAARLRPSAALFAGALAVAALTAVTLSLIHQHDASLIILGWNFGAAGLVLAADLAIGRRLLRPWPAAA